MCVLSIPVIHSLRRRSRPQKRSCSPAHLRPLQQVNASCAFTFSAGLWNCQSASKKADFITAFSAHSGLQVLALTETWIRPENSATPAALSTNFTFSHSPRIGKRGGGTGLLISKNWKSSPLTILTNTVSFEYHAVTISEPAKCHFVVIYRPPGQLENFVEELDLLLSALPDDGCPLVVLGDFNIHIDRPYAAEFLSLISSLDLHLLRTSATHKAGNQLDLIMSRSCSTSDLHITPLHQSDHFFIQFSVSLPPPPPVTALKTTQVRCNLSTLSNTDFSDLVTDALSSIKNFSSLDASSASSALCFTLATCLDLVCPITTRRSRPSPSSPWLTEVLRKQRTTLRAAERKWRKSSLSADLEAYQSLLATFSREVTTAKALFFQTKVTSISDARSLFSTFSTLLRPPSPSPSSSLSADVFATFFTKKIEDISKLFPVPHIPSTTPLTPSQPTFSSSFLSSRF